MKITTKEVLQWNSDTKEYDSISVESYDYEGEVDKCAKWDKNWWWGDNSLWGKATGWMPAKGSIEGAGIEFSWDQPAGDLLGSITGQKEEDYLKLAFMALGVYVIVKMVGK